MQDANSTKTRTSTKNQAFKVAAVQMASGPNVAGNLSEAGRLIEKAAEQGARLVVLPEYFPIMGLKDTDKVKVREQPGTGVIQTFLSETARKNKIWLVGGSIPLVASSPDKVLNTCLVFNVGYFNLAKLRMSLKARWSFWKRTKENLTAELKSAES